MIDSILHHQEASSLDTAGDEMVESGVIFVVAAGNDNQRVGVGTDDPHLNDYLTTLNSSDSRAGFPQGSGTCPSGHRKWMHPNGVGHVSDGTEREYYHTINVGCMDEYIGGIPGGRLMLKPKYLIQIMDQALMFLVPVMRH